jgi:hypothetical protein
MKKLQVMIREQIENENMLCSYSSYQSNKPYFISISTLLDKISNSVPYENWVWNEEGSVVFAYEEDGYQVEMIMDNVSYLRGSKDALYHFANKYATLEETDYFTI